MSGHRHRIACGPNERFVAHRVGRVFVGEEVHSLQELIAGNNPIAAFRVNQSGIVADPKP